MNEAISPKRRWLRFSLRTLFLLTAVIAVFMGLEANRVRSRNTALDQLRSAGAIVFPISVAKKHNVPLPVQVHEIWFWRRLMGDESVAAIYLRKGQTVDSNYALAKGCFPESYIEIEH